MMLSTIDLRACLSTQMGVRMIKNKTIGSRMKRIISVLLISTLVLALSGCNNPDEHEAVTTIPTEPQIEPIYNPDEVYGSTEELETNTEAEEDTANGDSNQDINASLNDFYVRLLQNSNVEGENILISPLSIISALGMTSNGAEENTKQQMENTLGLSVSQLNEYMSSMLGTLSSEEKYQLNLANSIWIKDIDTLTIESDFLQENTDIYGSEVYPAAFDDATLQDINTWVSDNTDGMIDSILNEIPSGAVMYLINALTFDGEWEEIYSESEILEGEFTTEDGENQTVEMMYHKENIYLEDEQTTGFMKYYADRKYAFVALLPKEDISVNEYLLSLSGEKLASLLSNTTDATVKTALPKFEQEYNVEMSDILINMGITDAFHEELADFTGIGHSEIGNLFINRVLHKTYIAVDEKGTRAGAATAVEIETKGALIDENVKTVYLDRPFVYMLIDCENNLPIFMGTYMSSN